MHLKRYIFSYENKEILHGIDVVMPDKTTTAVIGPSGSGKTTFVNLIARFWDVDSGSVKIGGKDVREYTLESLMEQISMVFQNVYLLRTQSRITSSLADRRQPTRKWWRRQGKPAVRISSRHFRTDMTLL